MVNIKYFFIFLIIILCQSNAYAMSAQPKYISQSRKYHIVKKGDTLISISKKYNISRNKLQLYNNMQSDEIFVGQKVYLIPNLTQRHEFITKRSVPESGIHIVKEGEDIFTIMKMYEIDIVDLIDMNNLREFDLIAGEKIILKPEAKEKTIVKTTHQKDNPEFHIIRYGDNLYQISKKYKISISDLKNYNNLKSDNIIAGRKLYLRPQTGNKTVKNKVVKSSKKPVPTKPKISKKAQNEKIEKTISSSKNKLVLPVQGTVTSEFGMRNNRPHKGIDIATKKGTPIHAVLDGEVAYTGKQKGYGYVVILKHANDVMTIYAHNNANLVRKGAKVKQGQPIATLGNSGRSSGPHLHFEYRINGKAVNPRKVLPEL